MGLRARAECLRPFDRVSAEVGRTKSELAGADVSRQAKVDRLTDKPVRLAVDNETPARLKGLQIVQPTLARADRKKGFAEANFTGPLFRGLPKSTDVMQNQLGDCDEQAAARALAAARPDLLKHIISAIPGSKATKLSFANGDSVIVGNRFALQKKDVVLYGGGPGVQAPKTMLRWNSELEAGTTVELSQQAGKTPSFDALAGGGDPADVLRLWVGGKTQELTTKRASVDTLWTAISGAFKKHNPETLTTYDDKDYKYAGTGVVGDHTNAITGIKVEKGVRYVRIENPWGEHEPGFDKVRGKETQGNDGKNDGIFWLPIEKVKQLYEGVQIDHLDGKMRLKTKQG